MDSTRFSKEPEERSKQRTRTGLAFLEEELLSAERGEAPNLDRVLHAVDIICDDARSHDIDGIEALCQGLRTFILELREDCLELSVEDLDIFLVVSSRIRALVGSIDPGALEPSDEGRAGKARPIDLTDLEFAPEFLASGLMVEVGRDEVFIHFPQLSGDQPTAAVLADLQQLWERTPASLPWRLDLSALERIPVTLLATLTKLRISAGSKARPLQLEGQLSSLESEELSESLARYFQLV